MKVWEVEVESVCVCACVCVCVCVYESVRDIRSVFELLDQNLDFNQMQTNSETIIYSPMLEGGVTGRERGCRSPQLIS